MRISENNVTIVNFASTLILQGIAFLTTPLFTRMLGQEQYGIYSLFYSWSLIMTCVMGLSMSAAISTGIYTFKDQYVQFRNSLLLFFTLVSICEVALIVFLRGFISSITKLDSQIVILVAITSMGRAIVSFAQTCFIYEKRVWNNFFLSVGVAVATVGLSVFLILQCSKETKYWGRLYGTAISYVLIAAIVGIVLFRKNPIGLIKDYCKYGFVVGTPILFHTLSQLILGQSDRVMMQTFGLPLADIGIYSLFYMLSAALSTVLSALNNSWCPFYYDNIYENKFDVLNTKCKNYIELFTILGVEFLLFSREVSYLMGGKSYASGINTIPVLAFAVYFTFMYQFPVNFEFFHKRTKIIAVGTVVAAILNILLNLIMIPVWGMYGAALATALSYLFLFVIHYIIVKSMKDYPYHLSVKVFLPGILGMIIGSVAFYTLSSLWYVRWGIGIALGSYELIRVRKRKSIF